MAVTYGTIAELYVQGLSTDTKPTVGIPVNTRFLATDTAIEYIYDGKSTWNATPAGGGGGGGGVVTNAGTFAVQNTAATPAGTNSIGSVTQATAASLNAQVVGNVPAAGADSGNGVKVSGVYLTTPPTYTNGQRADVQMTAAGSMHTTVDNGVNASSNANSALLVQVTPFTSGGDSYSSNIAPATVAAAAVKTSAGQVYGIHCVNILATPLYLQLWDLAVGSITLGTTASNYIIPIPGNTGGAGCIISLPNGLQFSTAISWAVSLTMSKTDHTAITANSCVVNFDYK